MSLLNKVVKDWVIPGVIALVIALALNQLLFFLVTVPTPSMVPTIKPGDKLFVTRVHNTDNLKRGDIVVFYSDELEKTLVKRLIGLPNDEILIKKDGSVYINDEKINQPYVVEGSRKTGEFKVPENKYFFLGDNRPNSYDSHYWNEPYISHEKIKGKAVYVIFPFNRIGKLNK